MIIPRKKIPETLEELYLARDENLEKLRKAEQKKKILINQLNRLTRNERTHRLCTRGAMFEQFLPKKENIKDEQIMKALKLAFSQQNVRDFLEEIENCD